MTDSLMTARSRGVLRDLTWLCARLSHQLIVRVSDNQTIRLVAQRCHRTALVGIPTPIGAP